MLSVHTETSSKAWFWFYFWFRHIPATLAYTHTLKIHASFLGASLYSHQLWSLLFFIHSKTLQALILLAVPFYLSVLKWVSIFSSLSWSWVSWCRSQCAKHDPHSWVNTGEEGRDFPTSLPNLCPVQQCLLCTRLTQAQMQTQRHKHTKSFQSTHEHHRFTDVTCLHMYVHLQCASFAVNVL